MLPDDAAQPLVSDEHLAALSDIIQAFKVEKKFGIHLVHGHLQVADGKAMVGTAMTQMAGCWTRPTSISDLDLNALHGHIYVMDAKGHFQPYEFRSGAPPPMTAADNGFVTALQAYLVSSGLTGVLGLEVLTADSDEMMSEIVLSDGYGTVMMAEPPVLGSQPYRVTGWCTVETGGGVRELRGGAQHLKMKNGNHRVLVDSKLNPDRVDEKVVIDTMRKHGLFD